MKLKTIIPIFASLSLLASCSNDDTPDIPIDAPPVVIDMTVAESRAVTQSTDFGFELFRRLCAANGSEDVFMSPLSASMAMSMLANGASGQSQVQILTALGYAGDKEGLDALNSINSRLLTALPITDAQTKLALANSVWADNGFQLKDSFKQTMASVYKATVENVDMGSPATIDRINSWCSDNTAGLIPEIVKNNGFSFVLLNALYFKGLWINKFNESKTTSDYFMREDGSKRLVKMMNISEELPYAENSDFRITAKEFGNGAFRMYFLLPVDGCTLESSLSALTAGNWQSWIARMPEREINLTLPRFTLDGDYELNNILEAMGVSEVFDMYKADLSGMTTADAYISYVKQKTYIEVTEDGAEAAAVTVITGDLGSGDSRRVEFKLNRPFALLIAEKSTGAILFAGKVSSLRSAN